MTIFEYYKLHVPEGNVKLLTTLTTATRIHQRSPEYQRLPSSTLL